MDNTRTIVAILATHLTSVPVCQPDSRFEIAAAPTRICTILAIGNRLWQHRVAAAELKQTVLKDGFVADVETKKKPEMGHAGIWCVASALPCLGHRRIGTVRVRAVGGHENHNIEVRAVVRIIRDVVFEPRQGSQQRRLHRCEGLGVTPTSKRHILQKTISRARRPPVALCQGHAYGVQNISVCACSGVRARALVRTLVIAAEVVLVVNVDYPRGAISSRAGVRAGV